MTALPEWTQDVLELQLAMNSQTWARLQELGIDESAELRLDFFYDAPGEAEAKALADFLRRETDYDVDFESTREEEHSDEQWSVSGSTQPTTVSLAILDQWVSWMVTAGAENGGCKFDGWGAVAG